MALFSLFKRISQSFSLHRWSKIIAASLFSFGKIVSSAGGALFSVQQTLKTYHVADSVPSALPIIVVVNNVLLTSGTRAPPIFKKLLRDANSLPTPQHHTYHALDLPEVALPVSALSRQAKATYYLLLTLGYLSTPFSALNSYLSGITLIKAMFDLNEDSLVALACFVTVCSMMSYYSFNLHKMQKNILRCCRSLDNRLHGGHFGLTHKTLLITLLNSLFGVIAGVGTSFISTSKSLDLFPLTKNFDDKAKTTTVMLSVIASLFSSSFIFGVSSYDQVKAHFEPSPHHHSHHKIPYYAKSMVLIDSIINSLVGFIGIIHLLNTLVRTDEKDWRLILAGILPLLNNIFMNFSLGLVGCSTATQWVHQQKQKLIERCRPHQAYPSLLPHLSVPPMASERIVTSPTPSRFTTSNHYSAAFFARQPTYNSNSDSRPSVTIDIPAPNNDHPASSPPSPSPSPPM